MLDWHDLERLNTLLGRDKRGTITAEEKAQARTIMGKGFDGAWDLAWDDLKEIGFTWLGIYHLAKQGALAAAADA